jgi:hypothetical protein
VFSGGIGLVVKGRRRALSPGVENPVASGWEANATSRTVEHLRARGAVGTTIVQTDVLKKGGLDDRSPEDLP